ncbi:hypothetical protein HELRODRAFT_177676 [Helobdella robusta]|uniref:Uncharacterized protein n=1 Tax=Helobdella robusta TaxID=6412 RepID=T1FC22_HELRO|nr:hypothetical protein HELRODRAFT_177676 [Helobdella robusta]ESN98003.1 hypothetical protein HELRODRAFT_177676 [Helobdella robusta]
MILKSLLVFLILSIVLAFAHRCGNRSHGGHHHGNDTSLWDSRFKRHQKMIKADFWALVDERREPARTELLTALQNGTPIPDFINRHCIRFFEKLSPEERDETMTFLKELDMKNLPKYNQNLDFKAVQKYRT